MKKIRRIWLSFNKLVSSLLSDLPLALSAGPLSLRWLYVIIHYYSLISITSSCIGEMDFSPLCSTMDLGKWVVRFGQTTDDQAISLSYLIFIYLPNLAYSTLCSQCFQLRNRKPNRATLCVCNCVSMSVLHRSIDCTISIVFQLKSFLGDRRFYAFQGIYKSETKNNNNNNNKLLVCVWGDTAINRKMRDFKSTTTNDAQIFTHGLNGSVRVHFNREKYVRRWTTARHKCMRLARREFMN